MSKNKKPEIKVNKQLEELRQQVEELTNKWQRAVADYRNLEVRIEREKEEWIKFGNAPLILKMLEILDDLERAAVHIADSGLRLVLDKFNKVLAEQGVKELPIRSLADKFDPQIMECVQQVEGEKDQVVTVEQKGYLFHEKLLRAAKVKVGNGQN